MFGGDSVVPDFVVTNDDLAPVVDTSDEWIQQRTGIRERRYVSNGDGSVALAEHAARERCGWRGWGRTTSIS